MGCSLIGFTFVGPEKMKYEHAFDGVSWREIAETWKARFLDDENDDESSWREAIAWDRDEELLMSDVAGAAETVNEFREAVTPRSVEKAIRAVVKEFVRAWNRDGCNYRRWMSRGLSLPGVEPLKIVTVADMSWGDSPDDDLWRLCEKIVAIEALIGRPILGLR